MQTTIPPDRRQRIDALGYDYAAQPRELVMTVQSVRRATCSSRSRTGIATAIRRRRAPARAAAWCSSIRG